MEHELHIIDLKTKLHNSAMDNLALVSQADEHYARARELEQQVIEMQHDLDFLQEWRDVWLGIRQDQQKNTIQNCISILQARVVGDNNREEQEVLRCINDLKDLLK